MWHDILKVLRGDLSEAKFQALRADRDRYDENAVKIRDQRDDLVTTLLAIDEEIFRMSQCGDWETMRPIFQRLQRGAEARRGHVSNRIGEREIKRIKSEIPPQYPWAIDQQTGE